MYNMNDTQKLKQEVEELKRQVALLAQKVEQMSELQDDFSSVQIIRRNTQFIGKVYDKNGILKIN